ncbi:hypothetical protein [Corallococcus sp. 4LFB]|uniref:hypothetical protein n=1 Tax=Corallococcus sp. 4LFB TaxID=3383249 RepID=UPI0039753F25
MVRTDEKGQHFLKVPLGKLKMERMVPLDAPTYQLAQELRQGGRPGRTWLLESARGCKTRAIHFTARLAG